MPTTSSIDSDLNKLFATEWYKKKVDSIDYDNIKQPICLTTVIANALFSIFIGVILGTLFSIGLVISIRLHK